MQSQSLLRTLKTQNVGRLAALVLLGVAMLGPWTYSADGTPPAEWCDAPNVVLENQRCVRLVPGTEIISMMTGTVIGVSAQLVENPAGLVDRARDFLGMFLFLLLLFWLIQPFLSTLLLVPGGDGRRQVFQVVAWAFAAACAGWLLTAWAGSGLYAALWGIGLYLSVAISALALESIALVRAWRHG